MEKGIHWFIYSAVKGCIWHWKELDLRTLLIPPELCPSFLTFCLCSNYFSDRPSPSGEHDGPLIVPASRLQEIFSPNVCMKISWKFLIVSTWVICPSLNQSLRGWNVWLAKPEIASEQAAWVGVRCDSDTMMDSSTRTTWSRGKKSPLRKGW